MATPTPRLSTLLGWLASNDIWYDTSALRIVDENGAIRVVSTGKGADVDAVVVRMPKGAVMSPKNCQVGDLVEEAGLDGEIALALCLMHERSLGPDSPWHGYIQSLPLFEDAPLLWPESDVTHLLAGTEAERAAKRDFETLKEVYETVVRPVVQKNETWFVPREKFSFESFLRAMTVITSRAFLVDEYYGDSLVPLADAFNHRSDGSGSEHLHIETDLDVCPHCGAKFGYCMHAELDMGTSSAGGDGSDGDGEWSDASSASGAEVVEDDTPEDADEVLSLPASDVTMGDIESVPSDAESTATDPDDAERLEMRVVRELPKVDGEEVFNTYGGRSNAELLHRYGFTDERPGTNPHDVVLIDLDTVLQTAVSESLLPAAPAAAPAKSKNKRSGSAKMETIEERIELRVAVWSAYRGLFEWDEEEEGGEDEGEEEEEVAEHGHGHGQESGHRHAKDGSCCAPGDDGEDGEGAGADDEEEDEEAPLFPLRSDGSPSASLISLLHILACQDGILRRLADDETGAAAADFAEAVRVGHGGAYAGEKEVEVRAVKGKSGAAAKGAKGPKVVWVAGDAVERVKKCVAVVARTRREAYPTSLAEDEAEFAKLGFSATAEKGTAGVVDNMRLRSSLVVRISEKKVLEAVLAKYAPPDVPNGSQARAGKTGGKKKSGKK
ncbi:hypothetical protein M427DRAFT_148123 [Gonapodya prolifera JEL478]|uniref:SET domain-containing protein n=1 Tax=Gonapodya prolifera (strain JEL478) TaxID=1344416 RepID=A0A139A412_GONPJ|nr:hypothetical protein M427DRAFT_148123 [Gonapodya prolifera JEL478]|eukprot:KXS11103.1 hypothetical protein M427DRAFT_148123 [Gonapodya prolifera JEL478]